MSKTKNNQVNQYSLSCGIDHYLPAAQISWLTRHCLLPLPVSVTRYKYPCQHQFLSMLGWFRNAQDNFFVNGFDIHNSCIDCSMSRLAFCLVVDTVILQWSVIYYSNYLLIMWSHLCAIVSVVQLFWLEFSGMFLFVLDSLCVLFSIVHTAVYRRFIIMNATCKFDDPALTCKFWRNPCWCFHWGMLSLYVVWSWSAQPCAIYSVIWPSIILFKIFFRIILSTCNKLSSFLSIVALLVKRQHPVSIITSSRSWKVKASMSKTFWSLIT